MNLLRSADWSYLSYYLATRGIPSDTQEVATEDYEFDPWLPPPNTEAVTVTITKADAERLIEIVRLQE